MSTNQTFACSARELAVGYDSPLLQGIHFEVSRGEILALIGPNGAGKSTLLKTLAAQLAPQGGTILLDGQSLESLSGNARARRLALMLPHTRRVEMTSCFDFVSAGRYPYTGRLGILSSADKRQVWDALALVGATEFANRDFNRISDGQRQRILLARAICQQPDVILLDEPTSFLDIQGKAELLSILKTLARARDMAVIVSLHELDLAQKAADRVICVSPQGATAAEKTEAVFTAARIHSLYGLTKASYDSLYGGFELEKPEGEPRLFIIGGAGKGIPLYRRCQREGRPFYAGILYENDLDLPVARALASALVTQEAFTPITDETFGRAKALVDRCQNVLCVPQSSGPLNEANCRLAEYAHQQGKLVNADAF